MIGLDGSTAMTATGRAGRPHLGDQRGDERRLARAGRPGDPDEVGAAGERVQPPHGRLGDRRPVLDRGQEPCQRQSVAAERGVGERDAARAAASDVHG